MSQEDFVLCKMPSFIERLNGEARLGLDGANYTTRTDSCGSGTIEIKCPGRAGPLI